MLIAAPRHRLARAGQATIDDIATTPFLMRETGSGTREVVGTALAANGIVPPVAMDLGHTEAIKQAVAAGLGVSILSRLTIEHELALGLLSVVPTAGMAIERWFLIAERRQARRSLAANAFLALAEEYRHEFGKADEGGEE